MIANLYMFIFGGTAFAGVLFGVLTETWGFAILSLSRFGYY